MSISRFFAAGFLSCAAAAIPSVGHAAIYRQFLSKACSYTIEYPAAWRVSSSGSSDSFAAGLSGAKYVGMVVDCAREPAGLTVAALTASEMKAFRRQGYAISKPTVGHGVGFFTGHKIAKASGHTFTALIEVSDTITVGRGYALVFAGDAVSFKKSISVYAHMLRTFRMR